MADLVDAEGTGRLDQDEIIATFMVMLFAGHETTANLVGNGILASLAQLVVIAT